MNKLWKTILIVALFGYFLNLLTHPCFAQQTRLKVQTKDCDRNGFCRIIDGYGGCLYIGNDLNGNWVFATAAHNLKAAWRISVMVDGNWKVASIDSIYTQSDAALVLTFPGKTKLPCYKFGSNTFKGEKLIMHGLIGGEYESTKRGYSLNATTLRMESEVEMGCSGCPIMRSNGEVVGIQSSKDINGLKYAYIVPSSTYRAIIKKRFGKMTCLIPPLVVRSPIVLRSPVQKQNYNCANSIMAMQAEIVKLKQHIAVLQQAKPVTTDLSGIEQRLQALEPLLNRRLQLLKEDGTVTADKTYKPGDVMKIRGVYKSK